MVVQKGFFMFFPRFGERARKKNLFFQFRPHNDTHHVLVDTLRGEENQDFNNNEEEAEVGFIKSGTAFTTVIEGKCEI